MPLFAVRFEPEVPPVRKVGLFATAGLPEPEPPAPGAPPLVAIAVGKTNEGASFPANPSRSQLHQCLHSGLGDLPSFEKPVPLLKQISKTVNTVRMPLTCP